MSTLTSILTTTPTTITPISTSLTTACAPLRFLRINLISVESEVISITWETNNAFKQPRFNATISAGNYMEQIETEKQAAEFSGLQPDIEYQIIISTTTCGQQQTITRKVRTVAVVVEVSTRITNVEFTLDLKNENSQKHKEFVKNFIAELTKGFNAIIQALIKSGKMTITVTSIEEGSVVVQFSVATSTNVTVPLTDIKKWVADSLNNSTMFDVDLQNMTISDRDSCQPGLNDCSGNGTCIRQNATYTCQCNAGFRDKSPSVPGRTCEDVNECQTGNNTCSDLADCMNTPGNFSCSCFQGIVDTNPANPGTQCRDPNTCFLNQTNICALSDCLTMTVSECNNRKAFRMKAVLKSREFSNELKNPSSEAYKSLSAEITNAVVQTVPDKLNDSNFNITIIGFQNGSVVVNLLAFLSIDSNVTTATLQNVFTDAIKAVDNQSSISITGTTQVSTLAPTLSQTTPTVQIQPESPGFRVSTIVVGALLGFALLVIMAVTLAVVYTRKHSGTLSFGSFNTPYNLQRSVV
ncbi:uncharacterized protein LOC144691902 [Cetorhinus maximus]